MKPREDEWERGPDFDDPRGTGDPISAPDAQDEPQTFLALRRIEYIGRIHHMAFGTVLQQGNLPPAQMGALKVIIRNPGMSQRELADALHIQRATATVMLQKMEKAGYIDRRPDQDDQRVSRIYPTEFAVTYDAENKKAVDDYFEKCFYNFQTEEFEVLERILTKLGSNIREILEEGPEAPNKE